MQKAVKVHIKDQVADPAVLIQDGLLGQLGAVDAEDQQGGGDHLVGTDLADGRRDDDDR